MKVAYVCPACRDTINAPASLAGEESPCPKCGADVDRWPAPISSPGVVRIVPQPPPAESVAAWFYMVNGARRGPVTVAQLKALVESAVLRANDLLWRDGMPAWVAAGTVPELFPAGGALAPALQPPPPPADGSDGRDGRDGRSQAQPIQVNVNQVVERDEDRRPRRRRPRREGFCCPFCSSPHPVSQDQVAAVGWVVFSLLLAFSVFLVFLGLLMDLRPGGWAVYALILMTSVALSFASLLIKEEVVYCRECKSRVGR